MVNWLGNLNVNNNSYGSVIGENAGTVDSAQISDSSKALEMIKSLMPGQTLEGQLVSQDGKALQLLVGNNTLLNTTLDSQTNLSLGQNISFEVKSNNSGQITLRPLLTNVSNDATAVKALESASVNVTDKTIEMVDSLMKEGMPINKEMLQSMNRDMNLYPNADVQDLVMLHKMNLPVNDNTVQQMHMYNNNNQWMMTNIDTMSEELIDLLGQAKDANEFNSIVNELESLFGDNKASEVKENLGKIVISEENMTAQNNNAKNVFDSLKQIPFDKLDKKELVNLFKKELGEAIGNKFLMEPEKFADKEYVKKYYNEVSDTVRSLEQFLADNSKSDSSLAKSMNQMRGNIDFMNQMNELYNYIQLPLKMAGAQTQGDLYVYSKKRGSNQKSENEDLTALLHLSMEALGNIDVFLRLNQGKLTTDFSLEKEEMIDFIEAHIDELNKRLVDKGYNVTTNVGKLEGETKNVIDEIRNESPQITLLSSQTFDARA